MNSTQPISSVPDDLLRISFCCLSSEDLGKVSLVCKQWKGLVEEMHTCLESIPADSGFLTKEDLCKMLVHAAQNGDARRVSEIMQQKIGTAGIGKAAYEQAFSLATSLEHIPCIKQLGVYPHFLLMSREKYTEIFKKCYDGGKVKSVAALKELAFSKISAECYQSCLRDASTRSNEAMLQELQRLEACPFKHHFCGNALHYSHYEESVPSYAT